MKSQSLATLRAQMNQRLLQFSMEPVVRPFLVCRGASKGVSNGKIAIISAVNKISAGRLTANLEVIPKCLGCDDSAVIDSAI
jgi:hypothetical protein